MKLIHKMDVSLVGTIELNLLVGESFATFFKVVIEILNKKLYGLWWIQH